MRLLSEHLQECRRKAVAARGERSAAQDEALLPAPAERVFSGEMAVAEALLYFLKTGVLPWWFTGTEELFTPSVLTGDLLQLLHDNNDAMTRAAKHFSDEMMLALAAFAVKNIDAVKQEWAAFAEIAKQFPSVFPVFRQRYWTARLREKKEVLGKETIITLFTPFDQKFITGVYVVCAEQSAGKHVNLYATFLKQIIKISKRKEKNPHTNDNNIPDEYPEIAGEQQLENAPSTYQRARTDEQNSTAAPHHKKPEPGEAIYVHAAGLILLHPFLAELFTGTGLWKENRWVSQASPFKAVQLLSFLSYGSEEVPEYKLTFHKILTGMNAATPLPPEAPLLPEETATCTELLEAVLRHWTALRNTGVDGLREGFLLRSGKVQHTKNSLQLDVERLAQDVLLARLPWGYSTVKLPWLEPLLTVSWI